VQELAELQRQGMSIKAISKLTGWDRKTVRKYLRQSNAWPEYGPRRRRASKLDGFKLYLEERMRAGVWNAQVLLRELRARSYTGGYTILKDWLHPQRSTARAVAVRRFETAPGKQAQVDWGHLGSLNCEDQEQKLWAFTFTLGYSRRMMAEAAVDQKIGTLLRMHEEAFRQMGVVPEEILYDRMKTVWLGSDDRGEIIWHPVFLDFAHYWGFTPRLCRPYRAQTKGKVESGVKYLRRNFLCGLQGREPHSMADLNAQLREWMAAVANQRVHGTTRERVGVRWDLEQFSLQPMAGRPSYPYVDGELRKVARVDWQVGALAACGQRGVGTRAGWRSGCAGRSSQDRGACPRAAQARGGDVSAPSSGHPARRAKNGSQDPDQMRRSAPIVESRSLLRTRRRQNRCVRCRTEVGDEYSGRAATHGAGKSGAESGASEIGELVGARFQERAQLCRVSG
jgi:transposase